MATDERSEVYFGGSMDQIQGQQPEVKLTKFNVLPSEQVHQSHIDMQLLANGDNHASERQPMTTVLTKLQQQQENLKSLSANDVFQLTTGRHQANGDQTRKWPWWSSGKTTADAKGEPASPRSTPDLAVVVGSFTGGSQSELADKEPFQLVWRRLAFEVDVSTYDQLLDRTLRRVRSVWRSMVGTHRASEKVSHAATATAVATDGQHLGGGITDNLSASAESNFFGAVGGRKRVIFENLNGYINSGEISAILGPSGAGKTSLLSAICGRTENYRGAVQLVGGGKRRMRLSIIPQKDYLIENLTVRENLLYSSKILNTDKGFDHEANIFRVVKMLNLTNCFESSAANISGGEYKRVSIAQELLRQPDILILDEPTSGLDSLNCKNLIKSLVQLIEASRRGTINPIAIVMTIHQPDVEIFQMFDHVYCMARRGRIIFDGHPSEVVRVVREHSGLTPEQLPAAVAADNSSCINAANLLIEIASEDVYGQEPIERLAEFQHRRIESAAWQLEPLAATMTPVHHRSNNGCHHGGSATFLPSTGQHQHNHLATTMEEAVNAESGATIKSCKSSSLISAPSPSHLSVASVALSTSSNRSATNHSKELHQLVRDKRLTSKHDHSGKFAYHTSLLARRAFTSTIRDPLMTLTSLIFHLTIPFVMWTVYSQKTGKVRACPVIQREMELVSMLGNTTMGLVENLQDELMTALECSTMFFLTTYSFSMCSLSMAALAFPLNMHVLLKEVRNGWYNLTSYVVAKTISNFPFEVLFPVISLVMIYVMLGMPTAYLEWRMWAIALVMALISMISHSQGLIFGALCMDSVQTAIFLASASSLPLTLLSGFTARIKNMPLLLQKLSWLSLYRYSSDSINIIRFGFGTCPCEQSTDQYLRTQEPAFSDISARHKPLFTYYLTNVGRSGEDEQEDATTTVASTIADAINNGTTMLTDAITAASNTSLATNVKSHIPGVSYDLILNSTARSEIIEKLEKEQLDLFGRMADLMSRSFTYGRRIDNCDSVRSELLSTAGAPKDEHLPLLFGGMLALFCAAKLILFLVVKFKIGSRI